MGRVAEITLAIVSLLSAGCGLHEDRERWTPDQCLMLQDGTECVYFGGQPGVCLDEECEQRCASDAECNDWKDCTIDACDATNGLCSNEPLTDGTECSGGLCQEGNCALSGTLLPCTEQGIRNAIHAGGGPYTFACDGPTTLTTEAQIPIDKDVVLDGEGKLTLDGNAEHRIFAVSVAAPRVTAELRGFTMRHGAATASEPYAQETGGAVDNAATLTLRDCTVTGSAATHGGGIHNSGTLTLLNSIVSNNRAEQNGGGVNGGGGTVLLVDSTVTDNSASKGGGILGITINLVDSTVSNNAAAQGGGIYIFGTNEFELDPATAVNSTVSGNTASTAGGGIYNDIAAKLILTHTTISENSAPSGSEIFNDGTGTASQNEATTAPRSHPGPSGPGVITVSRSVISGECAMQSAAEWHSSGHNVESPGNTCGLIEPSDRTNVTPQDLNLGTLEGNGGPTRTHALLSGSVAIDAVPAAICELDADQRGVTRPQGAACDAGAFELEQGEP